MSVIEIRCCKTLPRGAYVDLGRRCGSESRITVDPFTEVSWSCRFYKALTSWIIFDGIFRRISECSPERPCLPKKGRRGSALNVRISGTRREEKMADRKGSECRRVLGLRRTFQASGVRHAMNCPVLPKSDAVVVNGKFTSLISKGMRDDSRAPGKRCWPTNALTYPARAWIIVGISLPQRSRQPTLIR